MTERDIFLAAQDIADPAERRAFVEASCGADPALRQRVQALLASHEDAGSFLEHPAVEQVRGQDSEATTSEVMGANATSDTGPSSHDGSTIDLNFLAPSDKPGSLGKLAHYDVLQVIGRGGFGVVFKAYDENLRRVVAIKVLAPQLATSAQARQRFIREAQAVASVAHENVITIHQVGSDHNPPYLVMSFVAGQSLQEKLDHRGPLGLKEILRIAMQTAQGLAAAHAQGIVHRDVKPANILLENGVERVKLTDFGLARAADDASLTQSGVIAGTPQYMSPEQADGKTVDHRSDLFSLGSVLYAMCTGHAPFRAESTLAVLKRVCEDRPRPIQEVNPEIPAWLCAVVDKLHAKQPAERYQSAKDVAEELGRRLAEVQQPGYVATIVPYRSLAAAPARGVRGVRGTDLLALGIFALFFAATFGGILWWFESPLLPYPVVEWTAAALALVLCVVLYRNLPTCRERVRVLIAYAPLILTLLVLGYMMWPKYTGRYFKSLLTQGRFAEANLMMSPQSPETFEVKNGQLVIRAIHGNRVSINLAGFRVEEMPINRRDLSNPNEQGAREHFGLLLKGEKTAQLELYLTAEKGRVTWYRDIQIDSSPSVHMESLQGTWIARNVKQGRNTWSAEQVRQVRVTFTKIEEGPHFKLIGKVQWPGRTEEGSVVLDTRGSVERIQITRGGGKNPQVILAGAFWCYKNDLILSLGEPGDVPNDIGTEPDSRAVHMELTRLLPDAEHDRLVALATEERDLAQKQYNAGRIPIHEYLSAQIRHAEALAARADARQDREEEVKVLRDLVSLWTKKLDITRQRHEAGVMTQSEVNAVEQDLIKAQARLRQKAESK
jgi:hypothetical protein